MELLLKDNAFIRLATPVILMSLAWDASLASANETIGHCGATPTKDAQIQCLEAALLSLSGETDERIRVVADEPVPEPEEVAAEEIARGEAPPEEVPTQAIAEKEVPPLPTDPAVVETADAPTAEASQAAETIDAPMTAPGSQEDELGAEQVAVLRGDKEEVRRVTAIVIEHSEVGYQKVRVRLDNGQTWQQTDGDRIRAIRKLRNDPTFAVELWKTKSGGYRMYIPSKDITLRVKRLQ